MEPETTDPETAVTNASWVVSRFQIQILTPLFEQSSDITASQPEMFVYCVIVGSIFDANQSNKPQVSESFQLSWVLTIAKPKPGLPVVEAVDTKIGNLTKVTELYPFIRYLGDFVVTWPLSENQSKLSLLPVWQAFLFERVKGRGLGRYPFNQKLRLDCWNI